MRCLLLVLGKEEGSAASVLCKPGHGFLIRGVGKKAASAKVGTIVHIAASKDPFSICLYASSAKIQVAVTKCYMFLWMSRVFQVHQRTL